MQERNGGNKLTFSREKFSPEKVKLRSGSQRKRVQSTPLKKCRVRTRFVTASLAILIKRSIGVFAHAVNFVTLYMKGPV